MRILPLSSQIMRFLYCLLFVLLILGSQRVHAQERTRFKNKPKLKKVISSPKGKINTPAKTTKKKAPTVQPAAKKETKPETPEYKPVFEPLKELSIVNEDTSSIDEGEISVVEVAEEIQVDSVWIKIAQYYSIWDSRSVNPYRMDASNFNDTVPIKLYDTQRFWSSPLVKGSVTSNFGFRGYRWHYGIDLDLDTGDSIKASFDGIVRIAKWDGQGYGNYVLLRHYNGLETLYGHMTKSLVEVGQLVKAGDLIGWGGSTGRSSGPHLHYEIRYQGNAINPSSIYDFPKNAIISDFILLTSEYFQYLKTGTKRAPVVRKVVYHKVRSGDTLSGISRKYGVTVSYLSKLNRMSSRSKLRAGQRIRIK